MDKKILIGIGILALCLVLVFVIDHPEFESGWVPDKPLEGDPNNLGNIHNPSLDELAVDKLFGIERYNYWFHFVGKGSDGKIYTMRGEFLKSNGRVNIYDIRRLPNEVLCSYKADWNSESGKRIEKDRVILWAPMNQNPESLKGEHIRLILFNDSYEFEAGCGNNLINLTFKKDKSIWYNKGKTAKVYPNITISGMEDITETHGYIIIDGDTISLDGMGHIEHFFSNDKEILSGIHKYGNEWWMPFKSKEIKGFFVVFGDYKDAGLLIDGDYVIPSKFDYFINEKDKNIRVKAYIKKGIVDITYHIFGHAGGAEYVAIVTGKFNGKEITDGFGWIEHIH